MVSEPVVDLRCADRDDGALEGWIVGVKKFSSHKAPERLVMASAIARLPHAFCEVRTVRTFGSIAIRA